MIQQDKDLLLKDLCARLHYGVYCKGITECYSSDDDEYIEEEVTGVLVELHHYKCIYGLVGLMNKCDIETIKPYLRPLSSMTEEETKEYHKVIVESQNCSFENSESATTMVNDWLLSKHFDVRGLIPKGLAIEVTENDNPYN